MYRRNDVENVGEETDGEICPEKSVMEQCDLSLRWQMRQSLLRY